MISKYINDLVPGNSRIIVPDFGAFMVQDTPEGKVISFNDFLKFNDGLLVNHIIKNEKVNKNQALDHIKEFIKEVETQFGQGKSYLIEGLGELTKDAQGNIKFSKTSGSKPAEKKPDAESQIIILDEKTVEPVKAESKKAVEPEVIKPQVEKPAVSVTPEPSKIQVEKPVESKSSSTTAGNKDTNAPAAKPTSTPIKTVAPAAKSTTTIKTKKKNPLNAILVVMAFAVIVAAGVWAVLTYHLIDRFMPAKEPIVISADTIKIEVGDSTSTIDTSAVAEVQPKIIEENTSASNMDVRKYYLIAGSFKVGANAERYSKKLAEQGFESEIINRDNGFSAVSIKAFSSKKEALAEWQRLKDDYPGTWILVK